MKSKVVIYTSTRADYGIYKPLINELLKHSEIDLKLFVTGTHLDAAFGSTVSEIEEDHKDLIGYRVAFTTTIEKKFNNLKTMAEAINLYSDALVQNKPDLAIVLGDRYETLSFAMVCSGLHIPIVHLHGGELSLGSLDDIYRHCITKLSNWHFVACEEYKQRVIQLGESPDSVFNFGALGVENALTHKLLSREELSEALGSKLKDEFYLFTFHPETQSTDSGAEILKEFLMKFKQHLSSTGAQVLITGVNNDPGSADIRHILKNFISENKENAIFIESLGLKRYLSAAKLATAVLGNSSSGILEAHSLGTPALNLGTRQAGRAREASVIEFVDIASLQKIDFSVVKKLKMQLGAAKPISIFGDDNVSKPMALKIADLCAQHGKTTAKIFYDAQVKDKTR